eukprot:scaffold7960_cov129-Isochrysis_galbana.AAC.2
MQAWALEGRKRLLAGRAPHPPLNLLNFEGGTESKASQRQTGCAEVLWGGTQRPTVSLGFPRVSTCPRVARAIWCVCTAGGGSRGGASGPCLRSKVDYGVLWQAHPFPLAGMCLGFSRGGHAKLAQEAELPGKSTRAIILIGVPAAAAGKKIIYKMYTLFSARLGGRRRAVGGGGGRLPQHAPRNGNGLIYNSN